MLYDPKWELNHEPWRNHLRMAAQLIRERGLAKGERRSASGSLCLHGAISLAAYGNHQILNGNCPAELAVIRYLRSQGAEKIYDAGAAGWNNAEERTAAEVIEALEAAAEQPAMISNNQRSGEQ